MNNKKIIFVFISAVALILLLLFFMKKNTETSQDSGPDSNIIFFYGQACPHCKNVEKFLEENKNIEEKVKFDKSEVWSSKINMEKMLEKAKICGISEDNLGVPMLWDGDNYKCLMGDIDIIEFFKNQAGE
jgi:glutaredoxin